MYVVLLARGITSTWLRRTAITLAVLLLAATISRSATLAAVATFAVSVAAHRHSVSRRNLALSALGVVVILSVVLARPQVLAPVAELADSPLASRVSIAEGSAKGHLELVERGVAAGVESVPRSLIGLGYGNGYLVLQDMFPGNRYGNFHSLYVTMFAESGIVALLLTLVLMGVPLVRGGQWRPLVAGAVAFNLFYQTTAEPTFWFILAMAWLTMPPAGAALRAAVARGTLRQSPVRS
jgi:O-antigen ligase